MEKELKSKMGTVAVILTGDSGAEWVETFSDEREITALEMAILSGNPYPLQKVYEFRENAAKEDEDFGDYVEDLLCKKIVRPEVQSHGVAWLRSKLKIEQFRQEEKDAAEVIAHFALAKMTEDPDLEDFILAAPGVQVRIRIFKVRLTPGTSASAA
ncbi:MAG: hypothetical protein H7301_12805 [Cryobacterium sp.]|nr:hypothetical protein [Oligoflexia bacterium]